MQCVEFYKVIESVIHPNVSRLLGLFYSFDVVFLIVMNKCVPENPM
jgi:hypothetical protein